MRVLVVGSGGREHALAWRLSQDPHPREIYAAPGNPGIASVARLVPCQTTDVPSLLAAAEELRIDLTVVGPEAPLAAGIVDAFRARGLRIFGPTVAGAALEGSKVFAKRLMGRMHIPTAPFKVFDNAAEAIAYVRRRACPLVVKADGLAAGKGVVVAHDAVEAEVAIQALMVSRTHGAAADRVVIEERLNGVELSVLALVGRGGLSVLPPAQDYKRVFDGNRGPNTGGMGAFAPVPISPGLLDRVVAETLAPTVDAMAHDGRPFTGVLYAGIMLTAEGPQVLEFNCRWGDPEAQVLLPLIAGDLATAMIQTLEGSPPRLTIREGASVCVVLASSGYPDAPVVGAPIHGLEIPTSDALVFHAGTAVRGETLVTAGGRVLNVVGTGSSLERAVHSAYAAADQLHFVGMHFRTDIGRLPMHAAGTAEAAQEAGLVRESSQGCCGRRAVSASMPVVGIVLGSESDRPRLQDAERVLEQFGIAFEMVVASAHRSPDLLAQYAGSAEARGIRVVIAAAGGAAHLAGAVAARTVLPVIGVPLDATGLGGLDALLATVQMPPGVPVATVAIGDWGVQNAALLAVQILATTDAGLRDRLREQKQRKAQELEARAAAPTTSPARKG